MIDTKGWELNLKSLADYEKSEWVDDYFLETNDEKYSVYMYNIVEWTMGSYAAKFAIFSNKASPLLILSSQKNMIWFGHADSIDYAPTSNCLIFKMLALGEFNFPFLIIKPNENSFSFIRSNYSSIYYNFNELEKDKIELKETWPQELRRINQNKANEVFDITNLNWFDLKNFSKALTIYKTNEFNML